MVKSPPESWTALVWPFSDMATSSSVIDAPVPPGVSFVIMPGTAKSPPVMATSWNRA